MEGRPEGGPCFEQESMSLEVLRTLAAAKTIIAAAMVAANWNARITVCGFALFIAASLAWIADGIIEPKNSLIIQNAVLLVINVLAYGAGYRAPTRKPPRLSLRITRPGREDQACFLSEMARRASAASPASVKPPIDVCPFLAQAMMLSAIWLSLMRRPSHACD